MNVVLGNVSAVKAKKLALQSLLFQLFTGKLYRIHDSGLFTKPSNET